MKYNHTDELFSGQRAAALAGIGLSRLHQWRFRRQFRPERGRCFTRRDIRRLRLLRALRDAGISMRVASRAADAADTLDSWAGWLLLVAPSGARVISEDSWERVISSTAGRAVEPVTVIRLGPIEDLSAMIVSSDTGPAAVRRGTAPGAGSPPAARGDGAEARVA